MVAQQEEQLIAGVRQQLAGELGCPLPAGRVAIGQRTGGADRLHLFDLVAPDQAVVGTIRTYTLGESGGRPAGKFAHCYAACLFLLQTAARRRLLVLTDPAFAARFRRESDGIIGDVEIIIVSAGEVSVAAEPEPLRERPPRRDAGPRGFQREDSVPLPPRRNKGGPGPRGRRPNTGQRRGR